MIDRSSDLANLLRKIKGGNVSGNGNIKKVQVQSKDNSNNAKNSIQPRKKCSSCSRKKKG